MVLICSTCSKENVSCYFMVMIHKNENNAFYLFYLNVHCMIISSYSYANLIILNEHNLMTESLIFGRLSSNQIIYVNLDYSSLSQNLSVQKRWHVMIGYAFTCLSHKMTKIAKMHSKLVCNCKLITRHYCILGWNNLSIEINKINITKTFQLMKLIDIS